MMIIAKVNKLNLELKTDEEHPDGKHADPKVTNLYLTLMGEVPELGNKIDKIAQAIGIASNALGGIQPPPPPKQRIVRDPLDKMIHGLIDALENEGADLSKDEIVFALECAAMSYFEATNADLKMTFDREEYDNPAPDADFDDDDEPEHSPANDAVRNGQPLDPSHATPS